MLEIGAQAPDIKVESIVGETRSLSDYKGQHIVLYFYPKDGTPGCTTQACNFRDFNTDIEELGAKVIGVSSDSLESHQRFTQNQKLNFELWSDPDHKLQEAFGVWTEKNMFGNKYMGTQRSTFVIDPDGKIIQVWEKANASKNPEQVLNWLQQNIK